MIRHFIGITMHEYKIIKVSKKENKVSVRVTCMKCKTNLEKEFQENKFGRLTCGNCNNKKLMLVGLDENKEITNLKIITLGDYNRYRLENDTDLGNFEYTKQKLFGAVENKEKVIKGEIDITKFNIPGSKERAVEKIGGTIENKYLIDKNGITFQKIRENVGEPKGKEVGIEAPDNTIINKLRQETETNFLIWCKANGELGELVIELYSRRKNEVGLAKLDINSKDKIWFNRGDKKGMFKNSPYNITTQLKIRDTFPKNYSYNKLYIYNYFNSIYETSLDKELNGTKVDIFIEELGLAIMYEGTTFRSTRNIDQIEKEMAQQDYRVITIEGTHKSNDLDIQDNIISINGRSKNPDDLIYNVATSILNEYDMRSYIRPSKEEIKDKMNLIY